MAEKPDILNSHFIIDGAPMPLTPARMLAECSVDPVPEPDGDLPTVADEHMDPAPGSCVLQEGELARYAALFPFRRTLPLPFAGPFTAAKVAQALIDAIWMSGHFRLGDLTLRAEWRWNDKELGNLAALYSSIESACGYIDALGVKLSRYALLAGAPAVTFKATTVAEEDAVDEEDSLFRELPYRTANPRISRRRRCAAFGRILTDYMRNGWSSFPLIPATSGWAAPPWQRPRTPVPPRPRTWRTRTISSTAMKWYGRWWRTAW